MFGRVHEPETSGDWGPELSRVLAEWNVDWKKAYVACKSELAGEEQVAARYQYLDAFAEARTPKVEGSPKSEDRIADQLAVAEMG